MNTNHQYFCRTHLGHLLNPGDLVLGFVLLSAIFNQYLTETDSAGSKISTSCRNSSNTNTKVAMHGGQKRSCNSVILEKGFWVGGRREMSSVFKVSF